MSKTDGTLTVERVRELLERADARDYRVVELTPSTVVTPHGRISVGWSSNVDPRVAERAEASAALIAAAPALARLALSALAERDAAVARAEALEGEVGRLREALEAIEAGAGIARQMGGSNRTIETMGRFATEALASPAASLGLERGA